MSPKTKTAEFRRLRNLYHELAMKETQLGYQKNEAAHAIVRLLSPEERAVFGTIKRDWRGENLVGKGLERATQEAKWVPYEDSYNPHLKGLRQSTRIDSLLHPLLWKVVGFWEGGNVMGENRTDLKGKSYLYSYSWDDDDRLIVRQRFDL
ncbi:MAG: hypothetical protein JRM77_09490 [Nitrososphaerota archaeon]|nr:hypothetical protein [Nitrososphaerota archaeon]